MSLLGGLQLGAGAITATQQALQVTESFMTTPPSRRCPRACPCSGRFSDLLPPLVWGWSSAFIPPGKQRIWTQSRRSATNNEWSAGRPRPAAAAKRKHAKCT